MKDEKNSSTDKIVGSTDLLGAVLATFPLIPPIREIVGENENVVLEWQHDGKYFEIEDAGDGRLEITSEVNGAYRHWLLMPNTEVSRAHDVAELEAENKVLRKIAVCACGDGFTESEPGICVNCALSGGWFDAT